MACVTSAYTFKKNRYKLCRFGLVLLCETILHLRCNVTASTVDTDKG